MIRAHARQMRGAAKLARDKHRSLRKTNELLSQAVCFAIHRMCALQGSFFSAVARALPMRAAAQSRRTAGPCALRTFFTIHTLHVYTCNVCDARLVYTWGHADGGTKAKNNGPVFAECHAAV